MPSIDTGIRNDQHHATQRHSSPMLALLALGVVFGDIGTSPLYAARETFSPLHGIPLNAANILGGLSCIVWALMLVVSLKYVALVLRADNRGEGGIMALMALALRATGEQSRLRTPLIAIGVLGAALFYGDAVLTPAISVLSAIEGLSVGTDAFEGWIVPVASGILIALFLIQKHGTGVVGIVFGPVCALWFIAIGWCGLWNILRYPAILAAIDPRHAVAFVTGHGLASLVVLGSVLLAVTGAEALYADMGHFGRKAIRWAWFGLVAPSLLMNYFGQGALLMTTPAAIENPFYLAFPAWALFPMVGLATAATVIASQATISGAYSITQQAIQLGYLPRMAVLHTSSKAIGQIYVPTVNWLLLVAVILTVIGFGSSTRLASAYGVAVMGTMLTTTLLMWFVARNAWRWPLWLCAAETMLFLLIEGAFLSAVSLKIAEGGWFPLALAGAVLAVMSTWWRGRRRLLAHLSEESVPLLPFLESVFRDPPHRVPGIAIFLTSTPDATPHALLHSLKHYRVLHQTNVFLTVRFADVPWVSNEQRMHAAGIGHGCWRMTVEYGFMDQPDIAAALERAGAAGLVVDPLRVSYFLSREKVVPIESDKGAIALWQDRFFSLLARNAGSVTDYFNVPSNCVVELGTRIQL